MPRRTIQNASEPVRQQEGEQGVDKANAPEEMIEAVGQPLAPCPAQAQSNTPFQPKDGAWSFRFSHSHPSRLAMQVNIVFTNPYTVSFDLCSEMNEHEVVTLKDWLCRIVDVMNGRP